MTSAQSDEEREEGRERRSMVLRGAAGEEEQKVRGGNERRKMRRGRSLVEEAETNQRERTNTGAAHVILLPVGENVFAHKQTFSFRR